MSKLAWAYIWGVFVLAAALSWSAWQAGPPLIAQLVMLAILVAITTVSHLFEAEAPNRQSYYPSMIFLFAGVLLLPPALFVLLAILPHLIEWAKERLLRSAHLRAWYIQPFNISTHIIAGITARQLHGQLLVYTDMTGAASPMLAATLAALAYVLLNHVLVGLALVLARGISWQESRVLEVEHLLPDFINLCLGYIVAVFWALNPWLILPVLSPIVLIYRALTVPQLKREAQTDTKTGLLNARYFNKVFFDEFDRAQRFERPLALLVADIDLMRNINNTYGHLAGDAVLAGIGQIIRTTIRKYDIAGRFGGEEFCIVLPEVGPAAARDLAERLRAAIDAAAFSVSTSPTPIHATLSIGVACLPQDASSTTDLIHAADVAVYQAKLAGRNRVVYTADVPHSLTIEQMQHDTRGVYAPATEHAELAAAEPPIQPLTTAEPPVAPAHVQAHHMATPPPDAANRRRLALFVSGVVAAGIGVATWGLLRAGPLDLPAIFLLTVLALVAELLQINVYDDTTFSVSVALVFAVALIAGIPGVMVVSTAIVLVHYLLRRPAPYKTAFNWATHMLGGTVPVFAFHMVNVPLTITSLPVLIVTMSVAGAAHYMIESGLFATFMSLANGTRPHVQWREQFGWLGGHYLALCVMGLFLGIAYASMGVVGVLVFTLPVLMMRFAQKQYTERTAGSMRELKRMNQELQRANAEIASASQSIHQLNDELFLTLAKIIDARDPYASGHAGKVADYALLIARELNMSLDQQNHVFQAGLLHDIGKLGIPEEILNKPGKLSTDEYTQIKTHSVLGAEFLEACQGLRHLAPFVRYHHERWDGAGYPEGLSGEAIPLLARILNVCDSVEAMASDRPYHKGMVPDHVLIEVRQQSGKQFDPLIAATFLRIVEREGVQLITNSAHEIARKVRAPQAAPADLQRSARSAGPAAAVREPLERMAV